MAKGIYVGVEEPVMKLVQGDIIPKSWTKVSNLEYVSDNGIKLTASSIYSSSNPLSNVCDGQVGYGDSYYFFTNSTVADQWVQIEFPTAQKITKINLAIKLSGNSAIKIRGSKNGSDWVELSSLTGDTFTFPQTLEEYALNNSDYYKFYRIVAISTAYNASMNLIVYEWQTTEYEAPSSETKGIARKVKKVYVGVEKTYDTTKFTSNPAPTSWTNGEDGLTATATNDYGTWTLRTTKGPWNTGTNLGVIADGNDDVGWRFARFSSDSDVAYMYLTPPTGVEINPTSIYVHNNMCSSNSYNSSHRSKLQGYDGSNWVDLGTLNSGTTGVKQTFTISGDTFFSEFRLEIYRLSGSPL